MNPTAMAIVGLAGRFPGADTIDEYWANLVRGIDSIERADPIDGQPSFVRAVGRVANIDLFDAQYFRISPAEAAVIDPQARALLELSAIALEDAGYLYDSKYVIGVFAGTGENHYYKDHVLADAELRRETGDTRLALANEGDFVAPRIAYRLGLNGPAISVQASCATGLTAVALACQAIAAGDCDLAIAGAASLLLPDVDGYVYSAGDVLSSDGRCRAFDKDASGTVPSSGAGVVVLKRDSLALADRDHRYAVIRGWATNNDGSSRPGFTAPSVDGQARVISLALRRAGVEPRDVSYVEAHGTGTVLGDPIEFEALSRVFAADDRGPRRCAIGSVKTNVGHTDAAAGIAGLIKASLAVKHGRIPASLHFAEANPAIDFDATSLYVNDKTMDWPAGDTERIAGVSSFGMGGINTHVVVSAALPANRPESEPRLPRLPRLPLIVSARTDADLVRLKATLADHFDRLVQAPASSAASAFADAAFTLAAGRPAREVRWAGGFVSATEAAQALRGPLRPPPTSVDTLSVDGTPAEVIDVIGVLEAQVPSLLADVAAMFDLSDLPSALHPMAPRIGGNLAVAVVGHLLADLGLRLTSFRGAEWARPAIRWLGLGGSIADLYAALQAFPWSAGSYDVPLHRVGESASVATLGRNFDLVDVLARAWAGGQPIDVGRVFADDDRQRVSLPTHPLNRNRFWRERIGRVVAGRPAEAASKADPVEDIVQSAWLAVLGLETVEPQDNFLDLGGDSIISIEIGARINEALGLDLPLDLAFLTPTVKEMVAFIRQRQGDTT